MGRAERQQEAARRERGRWHTHASAASGVCQDRLLLLLAHVPMRWEPAWRRAALLVVSLCLSCGLVTAAGSDHESATTELLLADGLTAKALLQVRPQIAAAHPARLRRSTDR